MEDWAGQEFQWSPASANKPVGCCFENQKGQELNEGDQKVNNLPSNLLIATDVLRYVVKPVRIRIARIIISEAATP